MKKFLKKIIRGIVKGAIFCWAKIYNRAKIIGTENIPKDGPLIFVGNHKTYLDPPLIATTGKRMMHFLAKKDLYNNKMFAFLGWAFEAIPVNRNAKDVAALKTSLKILKEGGCIALFPEGTRNGMAKGEKAKDGVAFFAVRSGAKVVPCGIKGGDKENRKVVIRYGKPLDFSEYKGTKDKNQLDEITDKIMKNITELAK